MKFQITETPDYILAVSGNLDELYNTSIQELINRGLVKAYQPKDNAPKLDLPLLPERVVEDDVEKLVVKYFPDYPDGIVTNEIKSLREGFIKGHKAATKIYSKDDLRKAIQYAKGLDIHGRGVWFKSDTFSEDEIIQSLKQTKTPKWFVAEMEKEGFVDIEGGWAWVLKTTTINGKTYLVGKYE